MKISAGIKILVIDDCLDTRNHIKLILRKKGFTNVFSCNNGEEGLEFLKKAHKDYEPVQLVLADWQMPKIDGLELLTRTRLDERFKNIPYIMITADNDRNHVLEVVSIGVDGYVVKPIKGEVLLKKISEIMRMKDSSRDSSSL